TSPRRLKLRETTSGKLSSTDPAFVIIPDSDRGRNSFTRDKIDVASKMRAGVNSLCPVGTL
ncbi:MAG TPA: hypothetical protein VHY59_09030, partial [Chthoniobacterales bacterium]|nr:hypothetical protein [Chthoniobacterales bacterium]